jgi:TRAP-type C4-dicarboxylate transport system permease small subunit
MFSLSGNVTIKTIERWLNYPVWVLHLFVIWLLFPALLCLVAADVILRTYFQSPLSWGHEVSGLLLICMFVLELPHTLHQQQLLQVDLLFVRLGHRMQRVVYFLSRLFVLAVAFLFCWQGFSGAQDMYAYADQAYTLPIPLWPLSAAMAVVGALLVLQALMQLISPSDTYAPDIEGEII